MARTEIFVVDDDNPSGHWVWIGGYTGTGVIPPVLATASGSSATVGSVFISGAGTVLALASGISSTSGAAQAVVNPSTTTQFVDFNGVAGAVANVPFDAAFALTATKRTFRFRIRKNGSWSPADNEFLVDRWGNTANWSWFLRWNSNGLPYFQYSTTGSNSVALPSPALPSPPLPVGSRFWLQIETLADGTLRVSTHPDQAPEPTTGWTVVSTGTILPGYTTAFTGTRGLRIGGSGFGTLNPLNADLFQMVLRDESDAKVFQLDPDNWTAGTTWVTSTGHEVTLTGAVSIGSE